MGPTKDQTRAKRTRKKGKNSASKSIFVPLDSVKTRSKYFNDIFLCIFQSKSAEEQRKSTTDDVDVSSTHSAGATITAVPINEENPKSPASNTTTTTITTTAKEVRNTISLHISPFLLNCRN